MDSSSSDEEDYSKLLQAVDSEFINDELFNHKSDIKNCTNYHQNQTVPPSLRSTNEHNYDQESTTGLKVTPEFQKHIAKQLSVLLDKQLNEVDQANNKRKKKRNKHIKGIKLFQSSASYIDCTEVEDISAAHNANRRLREDVDSEEENKKIREVAVTPDWVLSGEAVRGWAKSTKGEVVLGEHSEQVKKKKKKKKIK